jgi:hypothetical protein
MKHFNYQDCTVEELANHVEVTKAPVISAMLAYYRDKGRDDMVQKIKDARAIVTKRKLLKRLEAM